MTSVTEYKNKNDQKRMYSISALPIFADHPSRERQKNTLEHAAYISLVSRWDVDDGLQKLHSMVNGSSSDPNGRESERAAKLILLVSSRCSWFSFHLTA